MRSFYVTKRKCVKKISRLKTIYGLKEGNYEVIKSDNHRPGTDLERNYKSTVILKSKIDPEFRRNYPNTSASAVKYTE